MSSYCSDCSVFTYHLDQEIFDCDDYYKEEKIALFLLIASNPGGYQSVRDK